MSFASAFASMHGRIAAALGDSVTITNTQTLAAAPLLGKFVSDYAEMSGSQTVAGNHVAFEFDENSNAALAATPTGYTLTYSSIVYAITRPERRHDGIVTLMLHRST